jgi:hypothetical protein
MPLRFWFLPTWSGDFRLEKAKEGEGCVLTVVDPTVAERLTLTAFLATAREKGWCDALQGLQTTGTSSVVLTCTLAEAAPLLTAEMHSDTALWTAVRHADGKITVEDGTAPPPSDAVVAATVEPPVRGCPEPTPCERRASEVLRAFCTASQWQSWIEKGCMRLVGRVSGGTYWLFHQDEAARRGLSRVLTDARGRAVCVSDPSLPPEEEALGIKLAVEHRESLILSPPPLAFPA